MLESTHATLAGALDSAAGSRMAILLNRYDSSAWTYD